MPVFLFKTLTFRFDKVQKNPVLGSPIPVLGNVKQVKKRNLVIFTESFRRDLFIVVSKFIFKNKLITLFFCVAFTPQTGIGQPKTGIIFYFKRGLNF